MGVMQASATNSARRERTARTHKNPPPGSNPIQAEAFGEPSDDLKQLKPIPITSGSEKSVFGRVSKRCADEFPPGRVRNSFHSMGLLVSASQ
jgi:hypothetical protein